MCALRVRDFQGTAVIQTVVTLLVLSKNARVYVVLKIMSNFTTLSNRLCIYEIQ